MDLPFFDAKMRRLLIEACDFDWSKVSPAIFGSLFQSVMDAEQRRNLGAHYTSEKNILKVISGLFLDDLKAEFGRVKNNLNKLREFHLKLARLRFFDPACGCGNFLVITYRENRRLELEVLKQIRELTGKGQMLDVSLLSLIDVDSFYGIEYEEFPAEIARVALWLTDHQANMELSAEFGMSFVRLPLQNAPNILHGNALRVDWSSIVSNEDNQPDSSLYVLGNPPFIGKQFRNERQNADMEVACPGVPHVKTLDYVCAWFIKAAAFIENTNIKVAFVATNSITQGEQVGILWRTLLEKGAKIHFAHRTFKWNNEASGRAQVHVVIVGFGVFDTKNKRLFDYATPTAEPHEIESKNINPYLVDSEDIVVSTRTHPLSEAPEIVFGNMPNDGGHLLFTPQELRDFVYREPEAEKYIKPFIGAHEFINNIERYCLWLKGVSPDKWRRLPEVVKRVERVKQSRAESRRKTTRNLAEIPYLFGEIRQPDSDYVLIPGVSSENRRYIPIGFLSKEVITSNLVMCVPEATLYHFGILTSLMHNAWMRQVCGRLESRYRYSNKLVYNNFPFPSNANSEQRLRVEKTAQGILDARLKYPAATLADLYDPLTMPEDLLRAHRENDEAVDRCYGRQRFKNELERLEFLFEMYRRITEPIAVEGEKQIRQSKRGKNQIIV